MASGICQHIYYHDDSRALRMHHVRKFWGDLQILQQPVKTYILDLKRHKIHEKVLQCGDLKSFDQLFPNKSSMCLLGFDCLQSSSSRDGLRDANFSFGCKGESRWMGIETPPDSSLYFSEMEARRLGVDNLLRLFKLHFDIADSTEAVSGLIDVDLCEILLSGSVFGSMAMPKMPLHRWIEQAEWLSHRRLKQRARGVFWGNYFGKDILHNLNLVCNGNFSRAYSEETRLKDGEPSALVWNFPNGVFVSLSMSPFDCLFGQPLSFFIQKNLIWLVDRLVQAGCR